MPYLAALKEIDLSDYKTREPFMRTLRMSDGLVEDTQRQSSTAVEMLGERPTQPDKVAEERRLALLSSGSTTLLLTFAGDSTTINGHYSDNGAVTSAWDASELTEMHHLSEFCGRNKLAVHKPSQLAGAVALCLTFDHRAHLAVYTGQEGCGADPSKSTLMFRPMHGTDGVDGAVIEQLIVGPLKQYEADGTAVFDSLAGAAVRRLQAPDEILMFVVDTSASMRQTSDFAEINDEVPLSIGQPLTADAVTEPEFYNKATFDDLREQAPHWRRGHAANQFVELLRTIQADEIARKHKDLQNRRENARIHYHLYRTLQELETKLEQTKPYRAALKKHEKAASDFLLFRVTAALSSGSLSQRWTWSLGDTVPTGSPANQIPSLPAPTVAIPDELECPISYTLMQDAVTAADGHVYSRDAISRWFDIRSSSPMTGLDLTDTSLTPNREVCDAVSEYIGGKDIPASIRSAHASINIAFVSQYGTFERRVPKNMSTEALYKLAFRGLHGRYSLFQLARDNAALSVSNTTISQRGIVSGDRISIRIADEGDAAGNHPRQSSQSDLVLIKVYSDVESMRFAYWVKRSTTESLNSIIWKWLRHSVNAISPSSPLRVWTRLQHSGDGLMTGNECTGTESIASFLNDRDCFGTLKRDKVFRDVDALVENDLQPMVLKVMINKARPDEGRSQAMELSRLDVLKQIFEALINRMLAYNYKTHVGLVTVGTTANLAQPISHVLENFRRAVTDMRASGDAALWYARALANDQLTEYAAKYPEAKKRIVCISDGEDTKSLTQTSHGAYWVLRQNAVALDSIRPGDEDNSELRAATYLLGCYCFKPHALSNALMITERFGSAKYYAPHTIVNEETVPPRKEHPNLSDDVVELTATTTARGNATSSGSGPHSNLRMSRIPREIGLVMQRPSETTTVFISEAEDTFWKCLIESPTGSPYEGGTFLLFIHADEGYPTFAPKARFVTKIKHPNVNAHGRICHSIFGRDWTSDTSTTTVLNTIFGLLYQPEYSDPVNTTATLSFHHDQIEYNAEVAAFVRKYASKSREQWRRELLADDEEVDEEMADGELWEDEANE